MADYRVIADTEVDPDAPVTSELAYAFRDNPIASFEGASGAPKLQDAALGDPITAATDRGRDWVLRRNARALSEVIGTYAFLRANNSLNFGQVIAGSSLTPASAAGSTSGSLGVAGSWRCMGFTNAPSSEEPAASTTLFLRIS